MDRGEWGWGLASTLFWGVILLLVVLFVLRYFRTHERGMTGHKPDALAIAKERYAKGEIDKDQFAQLKKDLTEK
jgi:putative membrane protein